MVGVVVVFVEFHYIQFRFGGTRKGLKVVQIVGTVIEQVDHVRLFLGDGLGRVLGVDIPLLLALDTIEQRL